MTTSITIPKVDDATKLRFAVAFLRTQNSSAAAMAVISDPGTALLLARTLPSDPVVLEEIERLTEEKGEDAFLPTKAAIAREIYEKAKGCADLEDYERLMKLYCNVRGYIEKPGNNVNVDVKVAPVMVMTDHGTDEEWQKKTIEQQRRLTIDANC